MAQSLEVRTAQAVGGLNEAQVAAFLADTGDDIDGISRAGQATVRSFVADPTADIPSADDLRGLLAAIEAFAARQTETSPGGSPFGDDSDIQSLGSGTAAMVLDGLTEFLVNRARTEITALYLERLREAFQQERTMGTGVNDMARYELRDIFPAVDALLQSSDVIISTQIGPSLKAAFTEDLELFVDRVDQHVVPPSKKTEVYNLAMAAYHAARAVNAGQAPLVVVKGLKQRISPRKERTVESALFVLADMADVFSMPDAAGDRLMDLDILAAFDDRQWRYLQRLLVARDETAYAFLGPEDGGPEAQTVIEAAQAVVRGLAAWEQLIAKGGAAVVTGGAGGVDTSVWGSDAASATTPETRPAAPRSLVAMATVPLLIDTVGELVALSPAETGTAVPRLNAAKRLAEIPLLYQQGDYARIIPRCVTAYCDLGLGELSQQPVLTYAAFAADVAMAESSSQVAELFEQAALPPGSARQKGQYGGLYLNAYVGLAGGPEWVSDTSGTGWHLSAFAPVGIEYAFSGHVSAMASVIDVGVLVSRHLGHDDDGKVAKDSNTSFAQVFAPGGFVTWRPAANPLAVCLGAQLAPELREVADDDAATTSDKMAVRLTLAISVDIPIFRF